MMALATRSEANPVDITSEEGRSIAWEMWINRISLAKIKEMIDEGKDVNRRASQTQGFTTTALMASTCYHVECMRTLLNAGAQVNLQQSEGYTALHFAIDHNHTEQVAILLAHGADINISNKDEVTPFLMVEEMKNEVIKSLVTNTQQWREEFFADYQHIE